MVEWAVDAPHEETGWPVRGEIHEAAKCAGVTDSNSPFLNQYESRVPGVLAALIVQTLFAASWDFIILHNPRLLHGIGLSLAAEIMEGQGKRLEAEAHQCAWLRDIFGGPLWSNPIEPRWLTSIVVDLARTIYNQTAFERMPILADALMDAGRDNEEIISHCRGDGPHVRGCWVVDLLLFKS